MDIASPATLQKALNTEKECTLTLRRDLVPPWIDIQGLPKEGFTLKSKRVCFQPKRHDGHIHADANAPRIHWAFYTPAAAGKPTFIHSMHQAKQGRESLFRCFPLIQKGYGVLIYEYPGFGDTAGKPDEEGCYAALRGASDYLLSKGVPIHRQVAHGHSLGGAITAQVATERPFKAVILEATLPPVKAILPQLMSLAPWWLGWIKWLPLRWFIPKDNQYDSLPKIKNSQSPILLMHRASGSPVDNRLIDPSVFHKTLEAEAGNMKLFTSIARTGGNLQKTTDAIESFLTHPRTAL